MKRVLSAMATSALALAMASPARADVFSPGLQTVTFSGYVNISESWSSSLSCSMTMDIRLSAISGGANTARVIDATLFGGLCGLYAFNDFDWIVEVTMPYSPGAATELIIRNLKFTGFSNVCWGSPRVAWNNTFQQVTFTLTDPALAPCSLQGTLLQVAGSSLSISK